MRESAHELNRREAQAFLFPMVLPSHDGLTVPSGPRLRREWRDVADFTTQDDDGDPLPLPSEVKQMLDGLFIAFAAVPLEDSQTTFERGKSPSFGVDASRLTDDGRAEIFRMNFFIFTR